ncbi:DNA polymerase III subunit delta' [Shewanella maritima]|uniref:DNA polymerase III subunit delta' n=1 Tax=Shewanella maritima TaxID=2520507 RepID=UPI003735A8CC
MTQALSIEQLPLPWLQQPQQQFRAQVNANRVSHANLVAIDSALGVSTLLIEMATEVLCVQPTPDGACHQCKSCLLLKAGSHPDLYQIHADGQQIKVDQIRQLCTDLTQTAQQGGYRVAIIYQAERLNLAAANALLKTLEEPGENTLLILQTDQHARLLATIKSRCQLLAFTTPTNTEIKHWLSNHNLVPNGVKEDVTWCLSVVGGPLALAESFTNDRYNMLLGFRNDWVQSLQLGYLQGGLAKVSEKQIVDALNVFYLYLRQYMLKSTKTTPFIRAKITELAGEVMQTTQKLTMMSNINCAALCQQYVLSFRHLTLA